MSEYVIRFFLGGIAVSAFAMGDDIQRPKSFAGLFSAAHAALQSRAMIYGAIALGISSVVVCQLLVRTRLTAMPATLISLVVWLIVAFGLLAMFGGGT